MVPMCDVYRCVSGYRSFLWCYLLDNSTFRPSAIVSEQKNSSSEGSAADGNLQSE